MGIRRGSISTPIIVDGLVFNMDAANRASYPRTGTTATDTVGNLTGSLTNGTAFSDTNEGIFVLDGSDDYIDCGNGSSIDNLAQNGFTSNAWINADTLGDSNTGRILNKRYNNSGWILFMDSANTIGAQILATSVIANSRGADNQLSLSSWTYVTMTYDYYGADRKIRLYVNGVEISYETQTTTTSQASDDSLGSLLIGEDFNLDRSFNGKIANTQIYNRTLSATEVLHNYNALKPRFGL